MDGCFSYRTQILDCELSAIEVYPIQLHTYKWATTRERDTTGVFLLLILVEMGCRPKL